MQPPRQPDKELQRLRKRKSERRKALKDAYDDLEAAALKLKGKLQATNGKKPQETKDPEPSAAIEEPEPEEQEAQ